MRRSIIHYGVEVTSYTMWCDDCGGVMHCAISNSDDHRIKEVTVDHKTTQKTSRPIPPPVVYFHIPT